MASVKASTHALEEVQKYISTASISGLYIAIKSNLDVEFMLEKKKPNSPNQILRFIFEETPLDLDPIIKKKKKKNRNRIKLAASSGGALAPPVLCNKALFPIRVSITITRRPPQI
ncbi:hypothetical protein ACSBR1_035341 [Camellia fascicularis]